MLRYLAREWIGGKGKTGRLERCWPELSLRAVRGAVSSRLSMTREMVRWGLRASRRSARCEIARGATAGARMARAGVALVCGEDAARLRSTHLLALRSLGTVRRTRPAEA